MRRSACFSHLERARGNNATTSALSPGSPPSPASPLRGMFSYSNDRQGRRKRKGVSGLCVDTVRSTRDGFGLPFGRRGIHLGVFLHPACPSCQAGNEREGRNGEAARQGRKGGGRHCPYLDESCIPSALPRSLPRSLLPSRTAGLGPPIITGISSNLHQHTTQHKPQADYSSFVCSSFPSPNVSPPLRRRGCGLLARLPG